MRSRIRYRLNRETPSTCPHAEDKSPYEVVILSQSGPDLNADEPSNPRSQSADERTNSGTIGGCLRFEVMHIIPSTIVPSLESGRRLVVISNRTAPSTEDRAGGLAVALFEALRERGGLWFGWSGKLSEHSSTYRFAGDSGVDFALTDLTPEEYDGYYLGYSNRCLWPLLHYRTDLAEPDRKTFRIYESVNRRFARELLPLLHPEDVVWVHDYHLIPFARELRALGWRGAIGFFLHVPFPAPEVFSTLPEHARLAQALMEYDLVGFQTEQDAANFRAYLARRPALGGRRLGEVTRREPRIQAFPIGIDPDEIDALLQSTSAKNAMARVQNCMAGQALVIGAERMDYSKGLPQRMRAFEYLLQENPVLSRRIEFLQVASPSRTDVGAYRTLAGEVESLVGRINGRFGDTSWTPIHYLAQNFGRDVLTGLYRAARIALVTPLRDGMNLVAKEFVAAQNPTNPGVLILSQFAGAAAQMPSALIVNPHDIAGVANAIRKALKMPRAERIRRWEELNRNVRTQNVGWWCRSYLEALESRGVLLPRREKASLPRLFEIAGPQRPALEASGSSAE